MPCILYKKAPKEHILYSLGAFPFSIEEGKKKGLTSILSEVPRAYSPSAAQKPPRGALLRMMPQAAAALRTGKLPYSQAPRQSARGATT